MIRSSAITVHMTLLCFWFVIFSIRCHCDLLILRWRDVKWAENRNLFYFSFRWRTRSRENQQTIVPEPSRKLEGPNSQKEMEQRYCLSSISIITHILYQNNDYGGLFHEFDWSDKLIDTKTGPSKVIFPLFEPRRKNARNNGITYMNMIPE